MVPLQQKCLWAFDRRRPASREHTQTIHISRLTAGYHDPFFFLPLIGCLLLVLLVLLSAIHEQTSLGHTSRQKFVVMRRPRRMIWYFPTDVGS